MTPPDNASNRTLAGIAAALGIAIGVAPTALLAQDIPKPGAVAVGTQEKVIPGNQTKIIGATQAKGITGSQEKGIPGSQIKGTPSAATAPGSASLNAFTYKKSPTGAYGAGGVVAGNGTVMPKTGSLSAVQEKNLPAVQSKGVPAVQGKIVPTVQQNGGPAAPQKLTPGVQEKITPPSQ